MAEGIVNHYMVSGLNKQGMVTANWPQQSADLGERAAISKPRAANLAYWLLVAALGTKHPILKEVRPLVLD